MTCQRRRMRSCGGAGVLSSFPLVLSALVLAGGCFFSSAIGDAAAADSIQTPASRQTPPSRVTPSGARIIAEDEHGVTVQVDVPSPVLRDRHGYFEVSIPGYGSLTTAGRPALPIRVERIALPHDARPSLTLLEALPSLLADGKAAPFPTIIRPNGKDGRGEATALIRLVEDTSVYESKSRFPAQPIELGATGALRGVPNVDVQIVPVFFDPRAGVRGSVGYFSRMTFRVEFGAALAQDVMAGQLPEIPEGAPFEPSLTTAFLNASQARRIAREGYLKVSPRSGEGHSTGPIKETNSGTTAAASTRYKLTVNKDGLYRLSRSWVSTNAPDLLNYAPSRYRMMDLGVEIPITVTDADSDGTFESSDYIEFAGQMLAWDILDPDDWQKGDFTDNNVYWLDAVTSASGLRVATRDGTPDASTPPVDFLDTIHSEVDDLFIQAVPADDLDHWHTRPSIQMTSGTPTSQTFNVTVPDASTTTTQASIKVKLLGDNYNRNLHRTNIYVNNTLVDGCGDGVAGCGNEGGGCVDWDGFTEFTHGGGSGIHFCQSSLAATTPVKIELPCNAVSNPALCRSDGSGTITADTVYLDWVEITYGRKFKVDANEALTFTYDNVTTRFKIIGLANSNAAVYEITKTLPDGKLLNPVRITGSSLTPNGPTFDLSFKITADGTLPPKRRFIVVTITASNTTGDLEPASVRTYTASDIRNPSAGADWMIVTDSDLIDTVSTSGFQKLITYRRDTQGKRVRTVKVEEIYDEFSYGIFEPQAIRDFLAYAYNNWPLGPLGQRLSEVVLIGDATFDMKNNYGVAQKRIWVPTYMRTLSSNSFVGYYSDDVYFSRVDGTDELPDIHLGRLPVHSLAESNSTCQKILDYDQQARSASTPWQHNVVLTAENQDTAFKQISEDTRIAYLAGTAHTYNRIYQQDLEPQFPSDPQGLANEVKDRMQRNLNGQVEPARDIGPGSAVFAFVGHGSWQNWGKFYSTFVTASSGTDDLTPVTNATKLPFLFVSNCLSGGFHITNSLTNPTDLTYAFTEDFLTSTGKGAVACLGPAHLTYLHSISLEYDAVFGEMYGPRKQRNVGEVNQALRQAFADTLATVDLRSFSLVGDPATTLVMPAPRPPGNVQVVSAGDQQIQLSWTASPDAASYRVFRSFTPSGAYSQVASGVTGTSYTNTGLTNCTTYYYQVASVDSGGFEGKRSNFNLDCPGAGDCVKGTPKKATAPSKPTGVQVVDSENGYRLEVSWAANAASDEVNAYTVRWSTIPNDPNPPNQGGAMGTTLWINGLTEGIRYYVTVAASNCSQGEGPRSDETSGVPYNVKGIKPPRWVSNLTVHRQVDTGDQRDDILLQWSLPGVDIYGKPETLSQVLVYHNTTGPNFLLDGAHLLATLGPTATSYVHEDAFWDTGKHYYLIVLVDNENNRSGGGHELPRGIDDLAAQKLSATQIRLTWGAIQLDLLGRYNPATQYKLYGSPTLFTRAQTSSMTPLMTISGTSVTLGMPVNPTYYYSVIAVDRRGSESPW